MQTDEARLWLAFNRLPGTGARRQAHLLEHLGTPAAVFAATRSELEPLLPRARQAIDAIVEGPDSLVPEADLEWLAGPGNHLLPLTDPAYPELLRQTEGPPALLYVCGDPQVLSLPQLAMVGSRNPTRSGVETAEGFARSLATAGLAITSGLATGIDGASHRGALAAGGKTIAIMGTGLTRVYPASHRELAHTIADSGGALVSEFPLDASPRREHFPQRNRLIAGLSLGTLVVEAAAQSGSLITARLAGEMGREVFAIPGSIHSPLARGCHALIRQGAKLVETAQDVVEELKPMVAMLRETLPEAQVPAAELPEDASRLLEIMGYDPIDTDRLVERSGLTADVISSMLLYMELEGIVEAKPGGTYQRIGNAQAHKGTQ